jgi:uncharacterized protein
MDCQAIIDKYYPEEDDCGQQSCDLRRLLIKHSRQVADRCLLICDRHPELAIDHTLVEQAAMLHDIGIRWCHAPSIFCYGTEPYIKHGPIGADLLRREGTTANGGVAMEYELLARVAERHTGTGLPGFEPQTLLEQVVCYADKFYSKSRPDRVLTVVEAAQSLEKFGHKGVVKFLEWARRFE